MQKVQNSARSIFEIIWRAKKRAMAMFASAENALVNEPQETGKLFNAQDRGTYKQPMHVLMGISVTIDCGRHSLK